MKAKGSNVCSFEDLNSGDIFKLPKIGSLFIKIAGSDNMERNCLEIETGILYFIRSAEIAIPVDGYFIEGGEMVENDS